MWAVDQACDRPRRALLAGTPWRALGLLTAGVGLALAAVRLGYLREAALGGVALWAMQIALARTALGWAAVDDPACPPRALGLTVAPSRHALLAAVGIGGGLALHLLVTASRTLGYPVVVDHPARVLSALVYDITVNVPCAELFFRGALLTRAQRRWSFGAALLLSTTTCMLRYLVDPALPKIPEVMLGAVFYIGLLGAANGWLVWWSGSLIPPFTASLLFFTAYRTLRVE
jgi:membrane protease YdiL (CAAX protease family)